MTTVVSGFGPSSGNSGTEFLSMLRPPMEALRHYDRTKKHVEQAVPVPQIFRDAMSVREEVFGEQGVPLEEEFDDDDPRSFHWVVYASVGTKGQPDSPLLDGKTEEQRRSSATAQRVAVGTIRLIPPPHGPNKYIKDHHPDADPPPSVPESQKKHPKEPYVKLGRLAVLAPFRKLGLSRLLINTALDYAAKNPEEIRPMMPPTILEQANQLTKSTDITFLWEGLAMVHAQVSVAGLWKKIGFTEELRDKVGNIEISKEDHWMEEGIEHEGLWKRLKLDGRL